MRLTPRSVPLRLAPGAYILHSGWEKWHADEQTAGRIHGFAVTAYPFLRSIPAPRFLKLLAAAEVGLGTALLLPLVPDRVAGALLTGFSGALMGLYWRAPGLREEGSVWPTQQGIAISKDIWMVGIGTGLLVGDRG